MKSTFIGGKSAVTPAAPQVLFHVSIPYYVDFRLHTKSECDTVFSIACQRAAATKWRSPFVKPGPNQISVDVQKRAASEAGYGRTVERNHPTILIGQAQNYTSEPLEAALRESLSQPIGIVVINEMFILYAHGIGVFSIKIEVNTNWLSVKDLGEKMNKIHGCLCQMVDQREYVFGANWHLLTKLFVLDYEHDDIVIGSDASFRPPTISETYHIDVLIPIHADTLTDKDRLEFRSFCSLYLSEYGSTGARAGAVEDALASQQREGVVDVEVGYTGIMVLLSSMDQVKRIRAMLALASMFTHCLNALSQVVYEHGMKDPYRLSEGDLTKATTRLFSLQQFSRTLIYEALPDSVCESALDVAIYGRGWDAWENNSTIIHLKSHLDTLDRNLGAMSRQRESAYEARVARLLALITVLSGYSAIVEIINQGSKIAQTRDLMTADVAALLILLLAMVVCFFLIRKL